MQQQRLEQPGSSLAAFQWRMCCMHHPVPAKKYLFRLPRLAVRASARACDNQARTCLAGSQSVYSSV